MNIIPKPKQYRINDGQYQLTNLTEIVLEAKCDYNDYKAAAQLQKEIQERTGIIVHITKSFFCNIKNCILIRKEAKEATNDTAKETTNGARDESYNISIHSDSVIISSGSSTGLFYGVQSLRQLIREYKSIIPCMEIKDEPSFKSRGFYHDITRGKVPTLDTLKDLVDRAVFYKLNQLQLYVEHTFAFKKYSEICRNADPITAEEIIELDEYCRERHVDLVPSLATFGHLYHALSTRTLMEFCELEVNPDEPFSWCDRMGHHTVDVSNPGSIEFVKTMLDEFIPLFSSKKFNICCDETFDLGEGKSRELAQKVGKGRMYMDFLKKVMDHVRKYDKEIMMWGDIVLEHPEYIKEIPDDVIFLNWWYWGRPKEDRVSKIAETGLQQYLCPAVVGWNNIMSYIDASRDNILNMTELAVKYGALGILNTDWGDFGHVNLYSCSIPGMIMGADLSWNHEGWTKTEVIYDKVSFIEYGESTGKLLELLRQIKIDGVIDYEWSQLVVWCYTRIMNRGIAQYKLTPIEEYDSNTVKKSIGKLSVIYNELLGMVQSVYPERRQDLEEFLNAAKGTALIRALFLIIQKHEYNMNVGELVYNPSELAEQFEYWMADYSKAWRRRNKESELFRIKEVIFVACNWLRDIGY